MSKIKMYIKHNTVIITYDILTNRKDRRINKIHNTIETFIT